MASYSSPLSVLPCSVRQCGRPSSDVGPLEWGAFLVGLSSSGLPRRAFSSGLPRWTFLAPVPLLSPGPLIRPPRRDGMDWQTMRALPVGGPARAPQCRDNARHPPSAREALITAPAKNARQKVCTCLREEPLLVSQMMMFGSCRRRMYVMEKGMQRYCILLEWRWI